MATPEQVLYFLQNEEARIEYYKHRPVEAMVDLLGIRPETLIWDLNPEYEGHSWDSTIQFPGDKRPRPCRNPIATFLRVWFRGYRRICLISATGTGKTFAVAGAGPIYLDTRRPSVIRTYAPTARTLEENMWGYMGLFEDRFYELHPKANISKDLHLYMDAEAADRARWAMMGYLAQVSTGGQVEHGAEVSAAAAGAHAEHMTLIVEEGQGVDRRIWKALTHTATGPYNQIIAMGNPDDEHDALSEFYYKENTVKIRVSGLDAPNYVCHERIQRTNKEIIPGGFSKEFRDELLEDDYNGNDKHPLFLSRTRGIIPKAAGDCLFDENALEAVSRHHRIGRPEPNERLDDLPWKRPLYRIEHKPERFKDAILRMARKGDYAQVAAADALESEDEAAEVLGVFDIEGWTEIYEAPRYDMVGRYALGVDVAGEYKEGDEHAAVVDDILEQRTVAAIKMTGSRLAYALCLVALARLYGIPRQRDPDMERRREEETGAHLMGRLYVESEAHVRRRLEETEYTPGWYYPMMIWETNNVGSLHIIPVFSAYQNLYRDRNPDLKAAKRSRRIGWQTKGDTRKEMIENLRDWGMLLAFEPSMVPCEALYDQMTAFKKDRNTGKYKAAEGHFDDLVLAKGIVLTGAQRIPDPAPPKDPPKPQRTIERRRYRPKKKDGLQLGRGGAWDVDVNNLRM